MSTRNPEFQRQLWLNWRPSLLAWSLGLSLLVLAIPVTLSTPKNLPGALSMTAVAGLWIAAIIYGSVLAGRSLSEEAQQNTWDWQRLSALAPWQMAWGKLLGATLPAWLYVMWFAIACAGIASIWVIEPMQIHHSIGLAMLWGLGLQTWAMNSVLISWGLQNRPLARMRAALLPLLLLLVFIPSPFIKHVYTGITENNSDPVLWWGINVGSLGLAYLAGSLVLGLGLLALWRQLCTRLDVQTLPWAWPLGLALTGFFSAGSLNMGFDVFLSSTTWIALLGTAYMALQHMDQHLRAWRQVQWSLSRQRWREALEALPLWPVSLLLGFVMASVLLFAPQSFEAAIAGHLNTFALYLCLHLLRDCLLLTGFALLIGKLKSPITAFMIAWLIFNIVAPLLAYGVAGFPGAIVVQPVVGLWVGSLDSLGSKEEISAWMRQIPWISLSLQTLAVLAWVVYIFRERVLGFARDSASA